MADWYVRPSGGVYGAEDGTSYANAWDGFSNIDWTGAGVQPGDTLYVCGAHSERLDIGGSGTLGNPITISLAYPSDVGSISINTVSGSGDWAEVDPDNPSLADPGSNFWVLDTGVADSFTSFPWFGSGFQAGEAVEYWVAGTTTFTNVTPASVPASDREFGFFRGGGGTNAHIGVYSVGNPVTYYSQVAWVADEDATYRGIQGVNREYITIQGGTFEKSARGIYLVNNAGSTQLDGLKVQNATFNNNVHGLYLRTSNPNSWIDGIDVSGNTFSNCMASGVQMRFYVRGAQIHDNTFIDIGATYSLGGVFFLQILADVANEIYDNTFTRCYAGQYFSLDGAGVETDENTRLTRIYRNTFTACWKAWHDNSGRENWFYVNRIIDCAMLSVHSDSASNNNTQVYIYHNVATGLTCDDSYNKAGTNINGAAKMNTSFAGTIEYEVKNNILIGAAGTENGLIRADALGAKWDEDYNCLWNFAEEVVDASFNAEEQGANAYNINPHLDGDQKPLASNLSARGTYITAVIADYAGNPFTAIPTIGAYELRDGLTTTTAWVHPPIVYTS